MPSLLQLDQAVREFIAENPGDDVTVVVDASFGHRIDPAELSDFEKAEAAGEVISPPAGAIGRGDAFLLRIAEKVGATVLSNDSFQEFHGEHPWLFDKGRLVGGKPVPGVGWIFMDRTPVRGAKSREVVKDAKRRKNADAASPEPSVSDAGRSKSRAKVVDRAIASATKEIVAPPSGKKSSRRRGGQPPAEPVNEPLAFITFIAAHPLGSEVVGTVVEYSSHGAFVDADGTRCYMPLSAMADPPPRRAREVVAKGEKRPFAVQAFDPQRRGVELAIPGFAHIAAEPTPETVDAEIHPAATVSGPAFAAGERGPAKKKAAEKKAAEKKAAAKKVGAKKAAAKKVAAKKAAEKKAPEKRAVAKEAPEKRAAAKKAAEKKAAVKKMAATKNAAATKVAGKKAAAKKAGAQASATTNKAAAEASVAAEKPPVPEEAAAKAVPSKRAVAKKADISNMDTKRVAAKKAPRSKKVAAKKDVADDRGDGD